MMGRLPHTLIWYFTVESGSVKSHSRVSEVEHLIMLCLSTALHQRNEASFRRLHLEVILIHLPRHSVLLQISLLGEGHQGELLLRPGALDAEGDGGLVLVVEFQLDHLRQLVPLI